MYLIRHGATRNNRERPPRLQGRRLDAELSPEGLEEARRTAAVLAPCPLDAVYSSPLLRARQTAEPMAVPRGLDVQIVEELVEVDVGRWEGMRWNEVEREFPEEYRGFIRDAGACPYFGGETLEQVRGRVVPRLKKLLEDNLGRTIAVVAHNVVNRTYLADLMGLSLARYREMPQDNCGVNVLRYRDGRTSIVTINSVFHLDG